MVPGGETYSIYSRDLAEMPESEHNDGKGIQFSFTFTSLPPKLKAGEKRPRKNSKKKTRNTIFYLHENSDLHGILTEVLAAVQCDDLEFCITRIGKLETDAFEAQYSIPRGAKDISLASKDDFAELVAQARKRIAAEVKLVIEEQKVCNMLCTFRFG